MARKVFSSVLVVFSLICMGCSKNDSEAISKGRNNKVLEDWTKKAPREPLPKPGHVLK